MRHRICVLAIAALFGMPAGLQAQGSPDDASLKLAHETVIKSVSSANLTLLQGMIHARASGFFRESQQIVQLGSGVTAADILPTLIADIGRFVSVPTDTAYRVVGTVGIVSMTAFLKAKKGENQPERYLRATYIYAWDAGNWRLVSWHGSDTPLKK